MSETLPSDTGISAGDIKKSLYERGSWGSVRATKKSLMPYGPEPKIPEDPICVEKRIDHNGGELWNETFGFSLSIPPGALAEGASEVITLTLLAEEADSLKLQKDDMIVSCGFKCSPAGLKFLKPVHLTIPHCAVLTDPSKVDTTLYLSDGSGLMASQKTSSHSCVARRNHFDVFLTQLAGGWPTIVFSERSFVSHLKMLCEVYFPREIQKHHDDCPFEVCLYKDFKGVQETRQYKRHESSVIVEDFPVEFLLSAEKIHHRASFIIYLRGSHVEDDIQELDLEELQNMVVEKVISCRLDFKSGEDYPYWYALNIHLSTGASLDIDLDVSRLRHSYFYEDDRAFVRAYVHTRGKAVIHRITVEPLHLAPSKGESDSTASAGSASMTCTRDIDHRGGELRNETFGISLSIPPGALAEGTSEVITLTILTEKPESLKLQDNEIIISYGFQCSPQGLKFLKPVHLEIRHRASLYGISNVQSVLYLGGEDGMMTRQKTPSQSIVAGDHSFDVSLTHLSYGWPTIVHSMERVQLRCEPLLPRTTQAHGRNTLDVLIYKNIWGCWMETQQYKRNESKLLITEEPFSRYLDLDTDVVVLYGLTGKHVEKKVFHPKELWHVVSGKVIQFPLDIQHDSLTHLKVMSGSEECFEFHMVLEFVGLPKDISHADWIQLHQSRRKRISPTTYELQHPSGGESDLKSSSGHASTTSSKIGAVTNIGDRIEKLSVHQKMPEGDRQKSHGPDQRSGKSTPKDSAENKDNDKQK